MVPLTVLWLPILVSAIIVFIASSIIWMALPLHRNDYKQLPDEAAVLDAMGTSTVGAGQYMFPYRRHSDKTTPEFTARFEKGPAGIMVVRKPGPFSMGTQLASWFVYCLGIALLVAYLTGRTLGTGTDDLEVFRVAGTAAILARISHRPSAAASRGEWSGKMSSTASSTDC